MGIDDLIGADDNLVYTLYDGLLGRAPEAAGLQGWLPQVSGLDTLHDLVEKFLESPEGQARHNGLDDRGFVNKLYEDNLHREAEDAGLNAWTDALSHGASRADVATAFCSRPSISRAWKTSSRPATSPGSTRPFWVGLPTRRGCMDGRMSFSMGRR